MSFSVVHSIESASLFQELLDKDITLRVKVTGQSMRPFLRGNETVTIRRPVFNELSAGDLIFFRDSYGLPVLHRIVMRKKNPQGKIVFVTKGDSLVLADDPVTEEQVLGKVIKIEKNSDGKVVKTINLESPVWRTINYLIALFSFIRAKLNFP